MLSWFLAKQGTMYLCQLEAVEMLVLLSDHEIARNVTINLINGP
jgi:hypothetical protein